MAKDLLRVLNEIRGTGEPEAPYTDGMYWDLTLKDYNGNLGRYGDMIAKHTSIGINTSASASSALSAANSASTATTKASEAAADASVALQNRNEAEGFASSIANDALLIAENETAIAIINSRLLTDVPLNAVFTDTVYNDTMIQEEVTINTAKRSYPLSDETKLGGIEAGATADQTVSDIVILLNGPENKTIDLGEF